MEIVDWALERRRREDLVRKRVVAGEEEEEGESSLLWSGKKTKRKPIPLPLFLVSFVDDIKPIPSLLYHYEFLWLVVRKEHSLSLSAFFSNLPFNRFLFNLYNLFIYDGPGRVLPGQILV